MSAQEERNALTPPTALHDHALHLLRESPDGVPPRRGYSLPHKSDTGEDPLSRGEARSTIREAFSPLPEEPSTLHRRFERLGIQDRHRHLVGSTVAGLPLPTGPVEKSESLEHPEVLPDPHLGDEALEYGITDKMTDEEGATRAPFHFLLVRKGSSLPGSGPKTSPAGQQCCPCT